MGSPESEKGRFENEGPQHRVRITKPFYLGTYEVTKGQFDRFVRDQNYKSEVERDERGGIGIDGETSTRSIKYSWRNTGFSQTDDHPVVNVTWNDAVAFCDWLTEKEGRTYLLPTEAQWEYACRSGTTGPFQTGSDPEGLALVGNVADGTAEARFPGFTSIIAEDGYVFTAPVGTYRANQFGVYDMHGNVMEWCRDRYDGSVYKSRSGITTDPFVTIGEKDPYGPGGRDYRVFRGGCWHTSWDAHSAFRGCSFPDFRFHTLGFRVSTTAGPGQVTQSPSPGSPSPEPLETK